MRTVASALLFAASLLLVACGGDDDDGTPDASLATCEDYCDRLQANCAGANAQYTSRDQCLESCASYPQGEAGATSGNSLECRNYHAGAALGAPGTHCVHAGPGGAGQCGANCDGFCQLVIATCTDALEVYGSVTECLDACGNFDATEPYDISDTGGDSLACRIYHATVATQDPETHCEHTGVVSATCQ
jgi:hypothetical protein